MRDQWKDLSDTEFEHLVQEAQTQMQSPPDKGDLMCDLCRVAIDESVKVEGRSFELNVE